MILSITIVQSEQGVRNEGGKLKSIQSEILIQPVKGKSLLPRSIGRKHQSGQKSISLLLTLYFFKLYILCIFFSIYPK